MCIRVAYLYCLYLNNQKTALLLLIPISLSLWYQVFYIEVKGGFVSNVGNVQIISVVSFFHLLMELLSTYNVPGGILEAGM